MQAGQILGRFGFSGYVAVMLAACASGPDKPDPSTASAISDEASMQPALASNAEPSGGKVAQAGEGMTRPVQIAGPAPSLPPEAIANHVVGSWVARCTITETGTVEECVVRQGLPYSDEHLLQILQAQRYAPVTFRGKPQRVKYTFKFTFK